MLARPLDSQTDLATFKKSIDDFVSALGTWRNKIMDNDLGTNQNDQKQQQDAPSGRFLRG